MFCDQCGTQLQPAQQTCARCGKPVLVPTAYRRNRVQEPRSAGRHSLDGLLCVTAVGGVRWVNVAHTVFGNAFGMHQDHLLKSASAASFC